MASDERRVVRAAHQYHEVGWRVIPVAPRGKTPLVQWKDYQSRAQTSEEIDRMFAAHPAANIGIITGAGSGIVAIDVDGPVGEQALVKQFGELPPTLVNRTGKGRHLIYRHPAFPVATQAGVLEKVDVRGDGGYIVAPPSLHESGARYEWAEVSNAEALSAVAPLPVKLECLLRDCVSRPGGSPRFAIAAQGGAATSCLLTAASAGVVSSLAEAVDGIPEGTRNATLARIAGRLLGERHSADEALQLCLAVNATRCQPPLDEVEVVRIVESIGKRERAKRATPTARAVIRRMADVTAEQVCWLWQGYVPRGSLTMWDGDPGLGKSNCTLDLAARVSTGRAMPDGTPTERGGVVLLCTEDHAAATIRPRLEAMGADLTRIVMLDVALDDDGLTRPFRLPDDVDHLRDAVAEVKARLVVIDPLMGHLSGKTNSWSDQEVRLALNPLLALAQEADIAVIAVRHPTKKAEASTLHCGSGSVAFVATARTAFLLGVDPDDSDRRVLAPTKSNVGVMPRSLAFRIVGAPNGASRVEWEGLSPRTARDLRPGASGNAPVKVSKVHGAMEFLRDALTNGPRSVADVNAEATARGIAPRTLERARDQLGVRSWRSEPGLTSAFMIALPGDEGKGEMAAD